MLRRGGVLPLLLLSAAGLLGACGRSTRAAPRPAYRVEHVRHSTVIKITLTPAGARRIGVVTAKTRRAGPGVVIPYSALVYDASGATFVFTRRGPLSFTEVRVMVTRTSGGSAYIRQGLQPDSRVVVVGAEELYGAQTGVLPQT